MSEMPAPFVVGVGRSGTTLLRLMLDAHPDLAIPAETHFLRRVIEKERCLDKHDFVRTLAEAATWPNMAVETAALQRAIDELEAFTVPDAIRAFYKLYARRFGKGRWGDKTPPYRSCMLEIERLLPEAHFIHIIRDGRDTALSYQGLWFGPGDNMETQAKFWVGQIMEAREQATRLRHYIEVKFERLVGEPEDTLGKICEYLGLGFNPVMLEYHRCAAARLAEHKQSFGPANGSPPDLQRFLSIHDRVKGPPDPERIGRWRREMTEADRQRFEAIAGALLLELGY